MGGRNSRHPNSNGKRAVQKGVLPENSSVVEYTASHYMAQSSRKDRRAAAIFQVLAMVVDVGSYWAATRTTRSTQMAFFWLVLP